MVMIALVLLLGSTSSFAQSSGPYPFKGRVLDKKTGQAVSGASILIKGSSSGVSTTIIKGKMVIEIGEAGG